MKKYNLIPLFIALLLVACSKNRSEFSNKINVHVLDAEKVVTIYDRSVQQVIDNGEFEKITQLSQGANDKVKRITDQLTAIDAPEAGIELKQSATSYLVALQKYVLSQQIYTSYTDSMSTTQIDSMENIVNAAFKEVGQKHELYIQKQTTLLK